MKGELTINGYDAYSTWGVGLEDGAMEALMTPLSMKEDIVNESRLEHGKRHMTVGNHVDEREITLPIHLVASSKQQYLARYRKFCEMLERQTVEISTKHEKGVVYRCRYKSCQQFRQFLSGMAVFALRLVEPNPKDRTADIE